MTKADAIQQIEELKIFIESKDDKIESLGNTYCSEIEDEMKRLREKIEEIIIKINKL